MSNERVAIIRELENHLAAAAQAGQRLQSEIAFDIINLLVKYKQLFPPHEIAIAPKVEAYRNELLTAQYKAWLEGL